MAGFIGSPGHAGLLWPARTLGDHAGSHELTGFARFTMRRGVFILWQNNGGGGGSWWAPGRGSEGAGCVIRALVPLQSHGQQEEGRWPAGKPPEAPRPPASPEEPAVCASPPRALLLVYVLPKRARALLFQRQNASRTSREFGKEVPAAWIIEPCHLAVHENKVKRSVGGRATKARKPQLSQSGCLLGLKHGAWGQICKCSVMLGSLLKARLTQRCHRPRSHLLPGRAWRSPAFAVLVHHRA